MVYKLQIVIKWVSKKPILKSIFYKFFKMTLILLNGTDTI